jgi:hypothetical protein
VAQGRWQRRQREVRGRDSCCILSLLHVAAAQLAGLLCICRRIAWSCQETSQRMPLAECGEAKQVVNIWYGCILSSCPLRRQVGHSSAGTACGFEHMAATTLTLWAHPATGAGSPAAAIQPHGRVHLLQQHLGCRALPRNQAACGPTAC